MGVMKSLYTKRHFGSSYGKPDEGQSSAVGHWSRMVDDLHGRASDRRAKPSQRASAQGMFRFVDGKKKRGK